MKITHIIEKLFHAPSLPAKISYQFKLKKLRKTITFILYRGFNMQTKVTVILSTLSLSMVLWGTPSYAHTAHFEKSSRSGEASYDFRSATMSIYKWYLSPMGAMVKGKMKFDAKTFAEYAQGLERVSMLHLMEGFPKDSGEDHVDDSDAKEEIWSHSADFKAKFKTFQSEAKKLALTAKGGDEAAIKAQFKVTAGTCSSCHKKYKQK